MQFCLLLNIYFKITVFSRVYRDSEYTANREKPSLNLGKIWNPEYTANASCNAYNGAVCWKPRIFAHSQVRLFYEFSAPIRIFYRIQWWQTTNSLQWLFISPNTRLNIPDLSTFQAPVFRTVSFVTANQNGSLFAYSTFSTPAWPAHYPIRRKKCRPNSQTHFRLCISVLFGLLWGFHPGIFGCWHEATVPRGEFVYVLHTLAYTGKMANITEIQRSFGIKLQVKQTLLFLAKIDT